MARLCKRNYVSRTIFMSHWSTANIEYYWKWWLIFGLWYFVFTLWRATAVGCSFQVWLLILQHLLLILAQQETWGNSRTIENYARKPHHVISFTALENLVNFHIKKKTTFSENLDLKFAEVICVVIWLISLLIKSGNKWHSEKQFPFKEHSTIKLL